MFVDEQGFQVCSVCGALDSSQNLLLVTEDTVSMSAQEQRQSNQLESLRNRAQPSTLRQFVNKRERTYASKMEVNLASMKITLIQH